MATHKVAKVNTTLPSQLEANTTYFVKTGDVVEQFITNSTGTAAYRVTGDSKYVHQQLVPASVWIVNHNLGHVVGVSVFTTGGVEVDAAVTNVNNNQAVINFNGALAGYATCQ